MICAEVYFRCCVVFSDDILAKFLDSESNVLSITNNDMVISLHNDSFWYEQSEYILNVFEDLVIKPFTQHSRTEAWQREVLDSYNNRNFDNLKAIVGRGQANFDEPFNQLTPADRVLLYCYEHMYQHVVSHIYIFAKHKNIFDKYIFNPISKILFIDFGCGPLSSGIALAIYYAKSLERNAKSLKFNYIGLDRAESMLQKAREFSMYPGLFHSNTTFDFFNPYADPRYIFDTKLYECINRYIFTDTLIIFNFSYFFASPSLDAFRLSIFIKNLLSIYLSNSVCLIFQNPQGEGLNRKWDLFQEEVGDLRTVINGPISETFSYLEIINRRLRITKLFYDIRFRHITGA